MRDLLSQINNQIINGEFNNLSDLYWLFTGNKNVLVINKNETNVNDVYYEAYEEGVWVDVDTGSYKDAAVVMLIQEPSVVQVTHQLLGALTVHPNNFVTYKGTHNVGSIRSTVARLKKGYDIDVCAYMRLGMLHLGIKTRNLDKVEELLNVMPFDFITEIPLNVHSTTARLRAFLHAYGVKHGCKFKTRVEGKNLQVLKTLSKDDDNTSVSMVVKEMIKQIPFDVPMPINFNLLPTVSMDKVKAMFRYHSNNTITFRDNVATKHQFIMIRKEGYFIILREGEAIYSVKSNKLNMMQIAVINSVLQSYGRKLSGRKIEKVIEDFPPLPTPPAL